VNNLAELEQHQHTLAELRRETNEFRKKTNDLWMKYPLPSGEDADCSFT